MGNSLEECIDLITNEIAYQKEKEDKFDSTGLIKQGKIQGLEIARMLITQYCEENV